MSATRIVVEPLIAETEDLTSTPPLSINDFMKSCTNLRRGEAVAIVRAICRAIIDGRDQPTDVELNRNHTFINADGTLSLTSRPHPEAALQGVRRLLLELLPPNEFVVAKALPDGSLEEFYEALEFYVASNPTQTIKDVRRKCLPRTPAVVAPPEKPVDAVENQKRPSARSRLDRLRFTWLRSNRLRLAWLRFRHLVSDRLRFDWLRFDRRRPIPFLVAGAILFATSAGVLALTLRNRHIGAGMLTSGFEVAGLAGSAELTPSEPRAASPSPTTSSRPAVSSSRSPAHGTARTPSVSSAGRADPQLRPAKPAVPPSRSSTRSSKQAAQSTVPSGESLGLGSSVTLSKYELAARSASSGAESPDSSAAPAIYDVSHRDVVPPEFIYPLLPGPLPTVTPSSDAPAIELTVNEQGTIDTVRASIPPRTIAEAVRMLGELSAAKTWRFRPASRSGQPVRYRLVLPLNLF